MQEKEVASAGACLSGDGTLHNAWHDLVVLSRRRCSGCGIDGSGNSPGHQPGRQRGRDRCGRRLPGGQPGGGRLGSLLRSRRAQILRPEPA